MYSLNEVKQRSSRKNPLANNRLHFFSSKFSIYFSWMFINFGMSANQVTFIFFLVGLLGSMAYFSGVEYFVLGYALWRLHIVFDLCDGDVARFNQTFSINGSYWDYMIHSVLYPLVYAGILYALYTEYGEVFFLVFGLVGSIIVSQLLAVKNNYYRAMLFSKLDLDVSVGSENASGFKYEIRRALHSVLSYEGFLFFITIISVLGVDVLIFKYTVIFYTLVFLAIVLVKLYQFSIKGFYTRRS